MGTLFIKHVPAAPGDADKTVRFVVARRDGKSGPPVAVTSPVGFPVEGRPLSDLPHELGWYLETFLDYPFGPNPDRAEHTLDALRAWGRRAFDALVDPREAGQIFESVRKSGHHELEIQVWSDDPAILGWPWEALIDPQAGFLAQTSAFGRRLNTVRDPDPVPAGLPRDRLNILLVTARPYAERDVRFRSISRPLVDLIATHHLAAHVHVLRPPTLERLREHLLERPGFYHVLHFDGHGAYGNHAASEGPSAHRFQGPEGVLVFEDAKGEPHYVTAETLSTLLREHAVPAIVLNACQSAMIDEHAADPFASVATALLRAGSRSIVAMAYSLYVSAAQQFLPAFYKRLFESGRTAEAVRAGRQQMLAEKRRDCARGKQELEDWLVPVLYEQDPLDFSFVKGAVAPVDDVPPLPDEAVDRGNPFGFVGRDGDLLALERALRGPAPAILVHGMGGVGKTTLARGLLAWLQATEGLGNGCFWFGFQEIRSVEFVLNRIGERLFGGQFATVTPIERKIELLVEALKAHRFIIVWDNFEVVEGVGGAAGTLSEADRALLLSLLRGLGGGASKVIVTSRSTEDWLGVERYAVPLGGLDGEERWVYCDRVLADLGIRIDRNDEQLAKLMDLLGGHPLAMRAILPHLAKQTAATLSSALRSNLTELPSNGDDAQAKLFATLRFVEQSLSEELQPLLIPLALHERFVDADYLEAMAQNVPGGWTPNQIDALCHALAGAGLLRDRGQAVYEMHPALTGYLRATLLASSPTNVQAWTRAFVTVVAAYADQLAPKELHEQRFGFHVYGASFYYALSEASRLGLVVEEAKLTQALAAHAQNVRNFREARDLFQRLSDIGPRLRNHKLESNAYHHLGLIAQEQRDFAVAKRRYRQSLAIKQKHGDEHGMALTYHQLGRIAEEQHEHVAAERWYRQSLAINEKQGDQGNVARTYHQLGMIAQMRRDFAAAERWYRQSLAIKQKQDDEHGTASTYHQLGMLAQEQHDLAAAEHWYHQSLAIDERLSDEHGMALSYHQLGIIAEARRDFAGAERWYRRSLAVKERQGDEHGAASTYHQMGVITEEQRDFAAAECWYRQSLAIEEKQGNEHGAAISYAQLALLFALKSDEITAAQFLIKAIQRFLRYRDDHSVAKARRQYWDLLNDASADVRPTFEEMWRAAGLGDLPEP